MPKTHRGRLSDANVSSGEDGGVGVIAFAFGSGSSTGTNELIASLGSLDVDKIFFWN